MIKTKYIKHNKEIQLFVLELINIYHPIRRESMDFLDKKLEDILRRNGHLTEKTRGVSFSIRKRLNFINREMPDEYMYYISITEFQKLKNQYLSMDFYISELLESLEE